MKHVQERSEEERKNGHQEHSKDKSPKGISRYIGWIALAVVLIVGAYFGYEELAFIQSHVDTEDAQTTGYISPVLSRVSGYVAKVNVNDNERVQKGEVIAEIDSTEYVLKVKKARSSLGNAEASLEVAKSTLKAAKITRQKAQQDFKRGQDLYQGGATTQQEFDDVKAAYNKAEADFETAKQKVAEARTRITERQDALDYARLQLSYTTITAPSDGVISKKDVEVGQLIQPGQPLMAVTDMRDVWVVANFKETQLKYIKLGQKVAIHVDAYPDKSFKGRVQSIAGGTGAKYALLPPDNATGNFVKVVQRVPVKITLSDKENPKNVLRQGLNVTATININQHVDSTATAMAPKVP